jgi:hypothetical protein
MMTLNSGHVSDTPTMMMMKNLFKPLLDHHDRGISLIGKKTDFFLFEKFRLCKKPVPLPSLGVLLPAQINE